MSKKAYLIAFGSFIVGALLGFGGTLLFGMAYGGKFINGILIWNRRK